MIELFASESIVDSLPTWSGVRYVNCISSYSAYSNPVIPARSAETSWTPLDYRVGFVESEPLVASRKVVRVEKDFRKSGSRWIHESVCWIDILRFSDLRYR